MCTAKRNNIMQRCPPPFSPSITYSCLDSPFSPHSPRCPHNPHLPHSPAPITRGMSFMTFFSVTPLFHHLQCLRNSSFVIRSHLSQKITKIWVRALSELPLSSERLKDGGGCWFQGSQLGISALLHMKRKRSLNWFVTPKSWPPLSPWAFSPVTQAQREGIL